MAASSSSYDHAFRIEMAFTPERTAPAPSGRGRTVQEPSMEITSPALSADDSNPRSVVSSFSTVRVVDFPIAFHQTVANSVSPTNPPGLAPGGQANRALPMWVVN